MSKDFTRELVIDFDPRHRRPRPGIFFVVSGPSGVGKNTLLSYILPKIEGVYYLPSLTTRPMRPGERQGFPYYFVSKETFEELIKKGAFLEWKKIHTGDYYGTHLQTILYALENGFDIITDMDVLGCQEVRKRFPHRVITIFLVPPDREELARRLGQREKDEDLIEKRLARWDMEKKYIDSYHHVIVNDQLERAGQELLAILRSYTQPNGGEG